MALIRGSGTVGKATASNRAKRKRPRATGPLKGRSIAGGKTKVTLPTVGRGVVHTRNVAPRESTNLIPGRPGAVSGGKPSAARSIANGLAGSATPASRDFMQEYEGQINDLIQRHLKNQPMMKQTLGSSTTTGRTKR